MRLVFSTKKNLHNKNNAGCNWIDEDILHLTETICFNKIGFVKFCRALVSCLSSVVRDLAIIRQ